MSDRQVPEPAGLRDAESRACRALAEPEPDVRLGRLKWLAIILPLFFLVVADYGRQIAFSDHFYSPAARSVAFALLAGAVFFFAQGIFALIGRLQRRIIQQNRHLAALNAIALASSEKPVQELLDNALDEVLGALSLDAGVICSVDLAEERHSAIAARGFSRELLENLHRANLADDPVASEVVETGEPVCFERLLDDSRLAEVAAREGVVSSISIPLKFQGEITGIMALASRSERRFDSIERELLANVGGQLGMAIRHAAVLEESLRRNREMAALLAVSDRVGSSLDLSDVLERAMEDILDVTSAEAAEIWLADEDGGLRLSRHSGAAPEAFTDVSYLPAGAGLPGVALQRGAPVLGHDFAHHPARMRAAVVEAGFQTYCALPLLHRGKALGVLGVAARSAEALTASAELRLLTGITEVISVAIENARLYEHVQDQAVLEERERIAREMHDGLAQVLTYVNAQTIAVRRLFAAGRDAEARRALDRMQEAIREVYADVREAILGLRSSPRSGDGLIGSLRSYLEAYEDMTGIAVALDVAEDVSAADLPSSTDIQVMRIVQEALTNVRKHAQASTVRVALEREGPRLRVVVEDDGRGFDTERLRPRGWPRFGLQTMRERAEAVGGTFAARSQPGAGTRIALELSTVDGGADAPASEPVAMEVA